MRRDPIFMDPEATRAQRRGDWMQTASGKQFWPLDPRPEEVDILDIAASLAKLCRYNGHCDWPYSVAQHSVYVSHQVPAEHALAALLHDATEAYCADVPRPLKPYLAGYAAIEQRIWEAIAERFQLPVELPACVKDADNAVLLAEKEQIMRPAPAAWRVPGKPAPVRIAYWGADQARDAFLSRFAVLIKARPVAAPLPRFRPATPEPGSIDWKRVHLQLQVGNVYEDRLRRRRTITRKNGTLRYEAAECSDTWADDGSRFDGGPDVRDLVREVAAAGVKEVPDGQA